MFAEEERLKKLSEPGDNLEKLSVIDWELFRPTLKRAQPRSDGSKGGRPPFDNLLMSKILVLQPRLLLFQVLISVQKEDDDGVTCTDSGKCPINHAFFCFLSPVSLPKTVCLRSSRAGFRNNPDHGTAIIILAPF